MGHFQHFVIHEKNLLHKMCVCLEFDGTLDNLKHWMRNWHHTELLLQQFVLRLGATCRLYCVYVCVVYVRRHLGCGLHLQIPLEERM